MGAIIAAISRLCCCSDEPEPVTDAGAFKDEGVELESLTRARRDDNDTVAAGTLTDCPQKPSDIQAPSPLRDNDPEKPHDIQAPSPLRDNDPEKPHDIQAPSPLRDNDPEKPHDIQGSSPLCDNYSEKSHDIQAQSLLCDNDTEKLHDIKTPSPPRDNDPQMPQNIQASSPPLDINNIPAGGSCFPSERNTVSHDYMNKYPEKQAATSSSSRPHDQIVASDTGSNLPKSFAECLIQSREGIVEDLDDFDDILEHLLSIKTISKNEKQLIIARDTDMNRVRELLDNVGLKGEKACRDLVVALRDTEQIHLCQLPACLELELDQQPFWEILSIDKFMTEMKVKFTEQIQERNEQEKEQYGNRVSLDKHVPVIINREHNSPDRQIRRGFDEFYIEKTDRKSLKLDDIFLSDESSRPHSVLMLGGPGMGKTSLCFTILNRFAHGQWGGHKFIFFLMLKRFNNVALALSLTDMLFDHGPIPMKDSKKAGLFKQLSKRQASVLVILDGYDEIDEFITDDSFISNPSPKSDVGIVLRSLWQGKLLPESQVLITSRPFRQIDMQHSRVVELAGLSYDSLYKLLGEFMDDTKEFLANHEDVANMLCIPINVQRFLSYLIWLRSQGQDILANLPKTKSSLYSKQMLPVVMQCHRSIKTWDAEKKWKHPEIKSFVLKLAQLAGSAITALGKKQVEFKFSDLLKCGLSEDDAKKGGLMTVFIKKVEGQTGMILVVSYYFTHLTTLEWCGGLYTASRNREYIDRLIDTNSGEFDAVLIFAVGLSRAAEGPQILKDLYGIPKRQSEKNAHSMLNKIVHSKRCRQPGGPQFALEAFFEGEFIDPRPLLSLLAPHGNVLQIEDIAQANRQAVGYFVRQLNSSQDKQTGATGTPGSEIGLDTVRLRFTGAADCTVQKRMVAEVCMMKRLKHLLIETDGYGEVVVERPLDMLLIHGEMTEDSAAHVVKTSRASTLCLYAPGCRLPGSTVLSHDVQEIHLLNVYLHSDTLTSLASTSSTSSLRAITGLVYRDDTETDIHRIIEKTPNLQAIDLRLVSRDGGACRALSRVVSAFNIACLSLYVYPDDACQMRVIRDLLNNASSLRELWLAFDSPPNDADLVHLARWVGKHDRLIKLSLVCDFGDPINVTRFLRELIKKSHSVRHLYTDGHIWSVNRDVMRRLKCVLQQVRGGGEGAFFTPLVNSDYLLTLIPSHVKEVLHRRYVSPRH